VYKHLPGIAGLTAHGDPVLEKNLWCFFHLIFFKEPNITLSFLHALLRLVLAVA